MKVLKENYRFIVLFLLFLFLNLILSPLNLDEIWCYGFSHSIYKGLIPYLDFNMVITPFYPFMMSIPFYLFGSNMLVFHIENAFLLTLLFYYSYRLIGKNFWLISIFFIWPINITFPNYNFLLLFLFVFLIYTEKKEYSDYIIGLLLGIIFLTKQSVGLILFLSIIYYYKDFIKIKKRIIGFLLPCIIFFLYLLITKSLLSFLDLCFFGLFDFGHGNGNINIIFFFCIMFLCIIGFLFYKTKKIDYFYLLLFMSINIPIFDYYHFIIFFIAFLIIFLQEIEFPIRLDLIAFMIFSGVFLYNTFTFSYDSIYPNDISKFQYRYLNKNVIYHTKNVQTYLKKYHYKVMFIGPDAYYHKLILDHNIDYLDLINVGNFGYHGTHKLIEKVKSLDSDYVFFVSNDELGKGKQTDQELIKYILKNGILLEKTPLYDVYQLNK